MSETILKTLAYQEMIKELASMSKEEINAQLASMGCALRYDQIKEQLAGTYNELSIADMIFEAYDIQPAKYPKTFIDEVVLEIAIRENYGFVHYGILSSQIRDIMEASPDEEKIKMIAGCYRKLCHTAQKFSIKALETMQYQVNDGVDLYAYFMNLLDIMMQKGINKRQIYRDIVELCDKMLKTFSQSHPFLRASIQYEQATAYIKMKSKKGEQIFQTLLKNHLDPCDALLHYALAYVDDDEQRALRILKKYRNLWDEKSDAYEVIQQMIQDLI